MQLVKQCGFTLIELSIVLVIIALIIGGIVVGKDLIDQSRIRSQIGQLDKYQQAVIAFKLKYNYLPGDIPEPDASNTGFKPRGGNPGEGDGNGVIEGNYGCSTCNYGSVQGSGGETNTFWEDLSAANFIDGEFIAGGAGCCVSYVITATTTPAIKDILPTVKLGSGNYIYVFSALRTTNFFGLANVTSIAGSSVGAPSMGSGAGLSVAQAYNIDKKIDDGYPQTGIVTTQYDTGYWFAGPIPWIGAPDTRATAPSTSSCYDNGSISGGAQQYTMSIDKGSNINCVLSFRFN